MYMRTSNQMGPPRDIKAPDRICPHITISTHPSNLRTPTSLTLYPCLSSKPQMPSRYQTATPVQQHLHSPSPLLLKYISSYNSACFSHLYTRSPSLLSSLSTLSPHAHHQHFWFPTLLCYYYYILLSVFMSMIMISGRSFISGCVFHGKRVTMSGVYEWCSVKYWEV